MMNARVRQYVQRPPIRRRLDARRSQWQGGVRRCVCPGTAPGPLVWRGAPLSPNAEMPSAEMAKLAHASSLAASSSGVATPAAPSVTTPIDSNRSGSDSPQLAASNKRCAAVTNGMSTRRDGHGERSVQLNVREVDPAIDEVPLNQTQLGQDIAETPVSHEARLGQRFQSEHRVPVTGAQFRDRGYVTPVYRR